MKMKSKERKRQTKWRSLEEPVRAKEKHKERKKKKKMEESRRTNENQREKKDKKERYGGVWKNEKSKVMEDSGRYTHVEEKIGEKKKKKYILLWRYIFLMSKIGK